MQSSFSPEYARHLGFEDAREGHTRQNRSWKDHPVMTEAYLKGFREGQEVNAVMGLDLRCKVRWDKPGFDTPECGAAATCFGFMLDHALPLCPRHARQAASLRELDDPKWTVLPFGWELAV
jgi:hypothetical protein